MIGSSSLAEKPTDAKPTDSIRSKGRHAEMLEAGERMAMDASATVAMLKLCGRECVKKGNVRTLLL